MGSAPKYIRLRWSGRCATCDRELRQGGYAWHDPSARHVRCQDCVAGEQRRELGIPDPPVAGPMPAANAGPVEAGIPGQGAGLKYERLHAAREARARERYGTLGVLATRLSGDPQHIAAWRIGCEGEVRLAKRLERLLDGKHVVLLHDRRIPLRRANIDHIAIGPGGVTVIDAKNVTGEARVERRGGLLTKRVEQLRVGGRDATKHVDGVETQVAEVHAALTDLGRTDVSVSGALCFLNGNVPLLGPTRIRKVAIGGPRRIAKLAARPGDLTPNEIIDLQRGLAHRLPAS